MGITYGLDIKSHEDRFLQTAERAVECAERAMVPGAFLVDTFPIRPFIPRFLGSWAPLTVHPKVKHVPKWFPGAGFKRFAENARRMFDVAVDGPLEYVKESMKVWLRGASANVSSANCDSQSGDCNVSIASSYFDQEIAFQNQGFDESDIRAVTSTTYIGEAPRVYGSGTTDLD